MKMESRNLFLIAEDDPDDQLLIKNVIDLVCATTLETRFVEDGSELMDFLKGNAGYSPNLVVLDLNMPRKDGRTALKEIKADPALSHIPVVVLTTSNYEADLQYCQSYGVDGYYRKPGAMAELKGIIQSLCAKYLN